jgi:hypothetical protein
MSRTAVVLIHGIGEQRPMSTLRSFVSDVVSSRYRSKPDQLSELYEVRRLSCDAVNQEKLDFYELYWAHHMRDSALWHLFAWLFRLLIISDEDLKKMSKHLGESTYLRIKYSGLLLLIVLSLISLFFAIALKTWGWLIAGPGAVVAALILFLGKSTWLFTQTFLIKIVGDAARYLDSVPDNIAQRQIIRTQCVRFLRSLTESTDPNYDRIVIIGHSLGSVIAYDALKLMWATLPVHVSLPLNVLDAENKGSRDSPYQDIDEERDLQGELFSEISSRNPTSWKVSDLITLGSPLVHAPILLAGSIEAFEELKNQRELPTCPPQVDSASQLWGWVDGEIYQLHHAAVFAVTRWTNFHFEGDPIGGPLKCIFGERIKDIELDNVVKNFPWRNHTRYWKNEDKEGSEKFRDEVRKILGI